MIRKLLGLLLLSTLSASVARADFIPIQFDFGSPTTWSAMASYDDATGVSWSTDSSFTAYQIVSLLVDAGGVATFDETEFIAGTSAPPDAGLLINSFGDIALDISALDSDTGLVLISNNNIVANFDTFFELYEQQAGGNLNHLFGGSYSASVAPEQVPSPPTMALLTIGLGGLGFRRNCNKKAT